MDISVTPPHVQYRRLQMVEQEHDAWLRDKELKQLAADRQHRLLLEYRLELAHFSKAHEEDKD